MSKPEQKHKGKKISKLKKAFAAAVLGVVTIVGGAAYAAGDFLPSGKAGTTGEVTAVTQNKVNADIKDFVYVPRTLTVRAGTEVTWTNHDYAPHDVMEKNRLFKSPMLEMDEKYKKTFTVPGTYNYICSVHPSMKATIRIIP